MQCMQLFIFLFIYLFIYVYSGPKVPAWRVRWDQSIDKNP